MLYNLRTDLSIDPLPAPPYPLSGSGVGANGGSTPKNTLYIDANSGLRVVRLTDASSGTGNGKSLWTADDPGGYSPWNIDSSLITFQNSGGLTFIAQFDTVNMTNNRQLGTADPYAFAGNSVWSRVNNNVLYINPLPNHTIAGMKSTGTQVYAMTFQQVAGQWEFESIALVCDFTALLPAGYVVQWQGELELSQHDLQFSLAVSSGGQDTGHYACIYNPALGGYRMLDTKPAAGGPPVASGQWGDIGVCSLTTGAHSTPTFSDFLLHGSAQTPNPQYVALSPVSAVAGQVGTVVWDVATLNLTCDGLGGHHGFGYQSMLVATGVDGNFKQVAYNNPSVSTVVIPANLLPPSPGYIGDDHHAFGPISITDQSICWITGGPVGAVGVVGKPLPNPFTAAWDGEIHGVDPSGAVTGVPGTVIRGPHTYSSGCSIEYVVAFNMVMPSPDGRFIAFTTDGCGASQPGVLPAGVGFGSNAGAATTTLGVDARGDVCIVALFPPVPTVTGVSPSSGSTLGESMVMLIGTNFTQGATVTIGGNAASSVVVSSSTQITCLTPAGVSGAATVSVTTIGGTATLANAYTYVVPPPTVASVSPNEGSTAAETAVTITGTNFVSVTAVDFAGSPATNVVVVSPTQITCLAPEGPAGTATISVTTPSGTGTAAGAFTYVAPPPPPPPPPVPTVIQIPTVTSISPNNGPITGGTFVTVQGTGFDANSTVAISGAPLKGLKISSGTTATGVTPSGAAGARNVAAANTAGTGKLISGFTYTS